MTWIPFFEIASKQFEDVTLIKEVFGKLERDITFENGYKLSDEAQYAMGWWFYTVYVEADFIKRLITHHNIQDQYTLLKLIQEKLNDDIRVKFHNKSIFTKYWSWLMR